MSRGSGKKQRQRSHTPEPTLTAFVVMPFRPLLDLVYATVIARQLQLAGYRPLRADTSLNQRAIMRDIIQGIQGADLIVGDLTGRNANVLYELGLAHALRKPTLLVAQSADDIPFDLAAYRAITYSVSIVTSPAMRLVEDLSSPLAKLLAAITRGEIAFENPFMDFALEVASAPTGDSDEEGVIDAMLRVAEDTPKYIEALGRGAEVIRHLGEAQSRINAEITAATEAVDKRGVIAVAARMAAMWTRHADQLQPILDDEVLPLSMSIEAGLLAQVRAGLMSESVEQIDAARKIIGDLASNARGAADGTRNFAGTVRKHSGWFSSSRPAGDRLAAALERYTSVIERIANLPDRAEVLIEQKNG